MFMFLFLFFSMLLQCSFFRLKELFFENAKNVGWSDDGRQRKKMMMALSFCLVSSVGRASVYLAGGRGSKPWPDQHSGSLNN